MVFWLLPGSFLICSSLSLVKAGALHLARYNYSGFLHPWTKCLCSLCALLLRVYGFNYSFHHFLWLLTTCHSFKRFFLCHWPLIYFTSGLCFCSIYANDKSYISNMLLRVEFSGVNYIPFIMLFWTPWDENSIWIFYNFMFAFSLLLRFKQI